MFALSANLSTLFRDLPVLERFAAAQAAGFSDVETWWPFESSSPGEAEVERFLLALSESGLMLRGLNFYAGDMAAGDRGVVSWPDAVGNFKDSVAVVRRIAEETGCRHFNALYGQRRPEFTEEEQDACALENLAFAASELAELDGIVLLEPLKHPDNGEYPLRTLDDAERVRKRVDHPHVSLLFDTFHLAGNGADLIRDIAAHAGAIGHVQLADYPGRADPGTGEIDFPAVLSALEEAGYSGFVACEFFPVGDVSRATIETHLRGSGS